MAGLGCLLLFRVTLVIDMKAAVCYERSVTPMEKSVGIGISFHGADFPIW